MRRAKWLGLLMVLALLVAACGGDDGGEEETGTTATDAGSETTEAGSGEVDLSGAELTLWGWSSSDAENQALDGLVADFASETGATAEFQPQAEFDVALQAALASGDPPDVFYVDSNRLPDLADSEALAPVPTDALSDPDDIYPSLREAFTYEDTWYCPPKDFSTLALVYDPDLLDAAGVEVPTTWEELEAAAATLTTGDTGAIASGEAQAGLSMGVEYPRWGVFLFQNGAALTDEAVTEVTLDNDAAREALDFVAGLFTDGYAVNAADIDAGWPGEAFGQDKVAMVIEGNWIVPFLNDTFPDKNFAVAELPAGPAGNGTFAFTVCYGVAANAANPEASWAFVDYLTNAEGALAWTNAFTVMPARQSVSDEWLEAHPELEAFVAGAEYAHKFGFAPGFGDVLGVFADTAQQIVAGNATVDDLIAQTTSAGEDILD